MTGREGLRTHVGRPVTGVLPARATSGAHRLPPHVLHLLSPAWRDRRLRREASPHPAGLGLAPLRREHGGHAALRPRSVRPLPPCGTGTYAGPRAPWEREDSRGGGLRQNGASRPW